MRLRPTDQFEIYLRQKDVDAWKTYKASPGVFNRCAIMAVFEPVNDTSLILVAQSQGGFAIIPRTELVIFNTETQSISPAYLE